MSDQAKLSLTGAILAGGRSSRLGRDKACVEIAGRSMLARAVEAVRPLACEILVVGRAQLEPSTRGIRCLPDERPGLGPMGGLLTALDAASHERVLCLACDMPLVTTRILQRLAQVTEDADAVALRSGDRVEPLCAIYHRRIRPVVRERVAQGLLAMHELLEAVRTTYVELDPTDQQLVFNVNTPEDLARAERLVQEMKR